MGCIVHAVPTHICRPEMRVEKHEQDPPLHTLVSRERYVTLEPMPPRRVCFCFLLSSPHRGSPQLLLSQEQIPILLACWKGMQRKSNATRGPDPDLAAQLSDAVNNSRSTSCERRWSASLPTELLLYQTQQAVRIR
jgi:hypothetical protein